MQQRSQGSVPASAAPQERKSRMRVLTALRSAPHGQGVQELADHLGLHANTVRFHLDRLVAEGVVTRHAEGRDAPGRPRLRFTAAPTSDPADDGRNYRMLAEILSGYVAATAPDPATAGVAAGRTVGRYLADRPAPFRRTEAEPSRAELLRILGEIGFEPELAQDDHGDEIRLHHCPFLEVAAEHQEVVCSIHLGLMQGALEELRAPFTTERLEPFVQPSLCVATLTPLTPSSTKEKSDD